MSYRSSSAGSTERAAASLGYLISSRGSISSAVASFRTVTGYTEPPFSALEMVFFDTPACLARSVIVQTRFCLSDFKRSTSSSIPKFVQILAALHKKVIGT